MEIRKKPIFTHYEKSSPLRKVSPAVKLAVCLVYMVFLTLVFDVRLLGLLAGVAVFSLTVGARLGPVQVLKGSLPFLFFGFGFFLGQYPFSRGRRIRRRDGSVFRFPEGKPGPSLVRFNHGLPGRHFRIVFPPVLLDHGSDGFRR